MPSTSAAAPAETTSGFSDPISAYTGIGRGRVAARSNRARPPRRLPVNATASTSGWVTSAWPTSWPPSCSTEIIPSASPAARRPSASSRPHSSAVAGWAGCALATTGQPAPRAAAVSVPATPNASGKLEAANTATTPSGTVVRCSAGAAGPSPAGSTTTSRRLPVRASVAIIRSWPTVRPSSPRSRVSPSAVSASAVATTTSAAASNASAAASSPSAIAAMSMGSASASTAAVTASSSWSNPTVV